MPVFAVNAASMSSSAFFIDAAANTVSVLSSALAGEWTAPHRIKRLKQIRIKRCIRALHAALRAGAGSRARLASDEFGLRLLRKRRSAYSLSLRPKRDIAGSNI